MPRKNGRKKSQVAPPQPFSTSAASVEEIERLLNPKKQVDSEEWHP